MEFLSHTGSHHSLVPIGYGLLRKTVHTKRDVHSASQQFAMHCFAAEFQSPVLRIPAAHTLESPRAYTMEHIFDITHRVPKHDYRGFPHLFEALCRFHEHMQYHGFWPVNYTIMYSSITQLFYLFDFSQFGTVDAIRVQFPFYRHRITLLEAETMHGILLCPTEGVALPVPLPAGAGELLEDDLYA